MTNQNKITIPVMLYGFLVILNIHIFSLILTKFVEHVFDFIPLYIVDWDNFPFIRLGILFLEIIFIVKTLSKISKIEILTKKKLFDSLMFFVFISLIWLLRDYYTYYQILCGNSLMEDNFYEIYLKKHDDNQSLVNSIENVFLILSVLIYTIYRIKEMPTDEEE